MRHAADEPVSTANKDGIWAFSSCIHEKISHFANPGRISPPREEVGGQSSSIVDAFDSNASCSKSSLQTFPSWGANGAPLLRIRLAKSVRFF